ncbi:SAM-dependent methyltransferase [Aliidiomarina sedimenti]|uniref:Chemotaxis protein methyltransferase n=2 Tax=Aliidiomarina sedimenti TaxID=1933879 RepID=A0ABY0C2L8_9GAMM|nr:SAM-dependent methyltransferase [Aliidiomarina sedimenti]
MQSEAGQSCPLTLAEFRVFQQLIYDEAGISMSDAKQALVSGRLNRRVRNLGLASYQAYYNYINAPEPDDEQSKERQLAVDLLTTNETYFFREPKHFDYLEDTLIPVWNESSQRRRIWSGASSSGEEAYSLAMVCRDSGNAPVEIVGTDISRRVLATAERGRYPLAKADRIPQHYLKKYCLKGIGSMSGIMQVDKATRELVEFKAANLQQSQHELGQFDLILLRNVMIYFNQETKRRVVASVCRQLKPGGTLMVGHSESLQGLNDGLRLMQNSVYQKVVDG